MLRPGFEPGSQPFFVFDETFSKSFLERAESLATRLTERGPERI